MELRDSLGERWIDSGSSCLRTVDCELMLKDRLGPIDGDQRRDSTFRSGSNLSIYLLRHFTCHQARFEFS